MRERKDEQRVQLSVAVVVRTYFLLPSSLLAILFLLFQRESKVDPRVARYKPALRSLFCQSGRG